MTSDGSRADEARKLPVRRYDVIKEVANKGTIWKIWHQDSVTHMFALGRVKGYRSKLWWGGNVIHVTFG